MQLGIFAKTFRGSDPETVLTAARHAGFSAVQYNMACSGLPSMPDAIAPGVGQSIGAASRTSGVGIAAVSGTYNMIHPDPAIRERGHKRLEVLASHCAAMGTRLITLCTGTRDPDDQWRDHPDNGSAEAWADLITSMERAIEIAERFDIDLGVEPELANVINSAAQARRLINEIQSPRLKVVLDPANLFEKAPLRMQREIVSSAIDLLADRIAMGHAKDRTIDGGFIAAGRGVLDYVHYLNCLRAIGFDGPLVTHGLNAEDAPHVANFLRMALEQAEIKVDA
jgi:sugar phosphate isomerase/epimerase